MNKAVSPRYYGYYCCCYYYSGHTCAAGGIPVPRPETEPMSPALEADALSLSHQQAPNYFNSNYEIQSISMLMTNDGS